MGTSFSVEEEEDDEEEGNLRVDHLILTDRRPRPQRQNTGPHFPAASTNTFLGSSWLMNESTESFFGDSFRGTNHEADDAATDLPHATAIPISIMSTRVTDDAVIGPSASPQTGRLYSSITLEEVFQESRREPMNVQNRSNSEASSQMTLDDEHEPFHPQMSRAFEWMGRSVESLTLGQSLRTPILALLEEDNYHNPSDSSSHSHSFSRRTSMEYTQRSSLDFITRRSSLDAMSRGSSVLSDILDINDSQDGSWSASSPPFRQRHGGTLANYHNRNARRRSSGTDFPNISNHRAAPRRSSARRGTSSSSLPEKRAGPNIVLSLLARETTGLSKKAPTPAHRLTQMGGRTLYNYIDKPAGGMLSEVQLLKISVKRGDWVETASQITRLAPRLIGDGAARGAAIDDPNLPASASPYYAGGGRLGLERDAFCLAGGVELLISIFRTPSFVGEAVSSNDARDLPPELVTNRLAPCWNEVLASLRELVYALPILVKNGAVLDNDNFLPFLFTLLFHDSVFDGAASLIEEILSLQSHAPPPAPTGNEESPIDAEYRSMSCITPVSTFFLGNVPDLYQLWRGFNCRQLAHFCRILALLVFEPEDRQILESPAVLKSLELLQLRRDRAARAGRDSSVDMNQAILLGDRKLMNRLLKLLRIMNYAPTMRRSSAYHVMAHFPFIGDTLVMLGLSELDNWKEVERLEKLSRKLISEQENSSNLSDLGSVTDMLESLSGPLLRNPVEPTTQLGHIIHVINAAQQAGVVVGRQRNGRRQRDASNQQSSVHAQGSPAIYPASLDNFATAAMTLTDQVMMRRAMFASPNGDESPSISTPISGSADSGGTTHSHTSSRIRINTPEDAANELQFNALLLAPYQVEVLFVLCTLLGGRRKVDAQNLLDANGLMTTLDEMFHRLTWGSPIRHRSQENVGSAHHLESSTSGAAQAPDSEQTDYTQHEQPNGIHGPGCECTPESALSVQYLRLLHNFCDRDCDNYTARRLLLSAEEREYVFSKRNWEDHPAVSPNIAPGLFTKVLRAFMRESDDSPYRFWLASCAESFLRGSSPQEQLFAARSGLLINLIDDIVSDKLHCAGSLQTSFDLLGELCKGNSEVLHLLVSTLDEEKFRKIMSAAAANLVDSNVFIRSLMLSVERIAAAKFCRQFKNEHVPNVSSPWFTSDYAPWTGRSGQNSRFYLTHSWWDTPFVSRQTGERRHPGSEAELAIDQARSSDWFPFRPFGGVDAPGMEANTSFNSSVGYNGWVFSPDQITDALSDAAYSPNTIERLSWFLTTNQARLLRDLLSVVDLRNINHENICCLNTAVVVVIFAQRRDQLAGVLTELRRMSDEDKELRRSSNNSSLRIEIAHVAEAMGQIEIEEHGGQRSFDRHLHALGGSGRRFSTLISFGDRTDVLSNFRELLWFWSEYYTHRGRDRLSLEFSSHLRFQEWKKVVNLLSADDGSSTALVRRPLRLPKSPYQRAAFLRNV